MPDRMVRDDLLESEAYWGVTPEARILFLGIWLSADDTARYLGSNFALRTHCMRGSVNATRVERLLRELIDADLVRTYDVDGVRFVFVPRFRQRLRFTNSRYPAPPSDISDLAIKTTGSRMARGVLTPTQEKRSEVKVPRTSGETPSLLPLQLVSSSPPSRKHRGRVVTSELDRSAREVIEYLNQVNGSRFHLTEKNLGFVLDRLLEGYTPYVLKLLAYDRVRLWRNDPKMRDYLRPATLFNEEKGNQYAGQIPPQYYRSCEHCELELTPDAKRCTCRPAEEAATPTRSPMPEHLRRRQDESVRDWMARLKAPVAA